MTAAAFDSHRRGLGAADRESRSARARESCDPALRCAGVILALDSARC